MLTLADHLSYHTPLKGSINEDCYATDKPFQGPGIDHCLIQQTPQPSSYVKHKSQPESLNSREIMGDSSAPVDPSKVHDEHDHVATAGHIKQTPDVVDRVNAEDEDRDEADNDLTSTQASSSPSKKKKKRRPKGQRGLVSTPNSIISSEALLTIHLRTSQPVSKNITPMHQSLRRSMRKIKSSMPESSPSSTGF